MAESKYTLNLCNDFNNDFPDGWIDTLFSQGGQTNSEKLKTGSKRILDYQVKLFINLSKLVLSGDHLINETNELEKLKDIAYNIEVVPEGKRSLKNKLQNKYIDFINDVRESIRIVQYHDSLTKKRFKPQDKKVFVAVDAIRLDYERINRSEYVPMLDAVCEACWCEYVFSNNEKYIRDLVLLKESLARFKKSKAEEIAICIDAAISKVVFLLQKLSLFSENKSIIYNFDFREYQIEPFDIKKVDPDSLKAYFMEFMDVELLKQEQIKTWQREIKNKDIKMWHLVFLMRYHVKKTKSLDKMNYLIREFEKHYKENEKENEHIVNEYACRSGLNYMYNSRFSYLCQDYKGYTLKKLKEDLAKIESIQKDTLIYNYHPYQKAIEFTIKEINSSIDNNISAPKIQELIDFLKDCFKKFRENVEWCKEKQPYLMQLRYNFSTKPFKGSGDKALDVFYPSSFCRPLRFSHLDENITQYTHDIAFLEYQAKHQQDKLELLESKKKIDSFEKKNLETMALVFTVTTFLVGMLSIFIGNDNKVSLSDKMEYVIVLGVTLLLFVSFGYFVVTDKLRHWKSIVFGLLSLAYIGVLIHFFTCIHPKQETNINKPDDATSIVEQSDSTTTKTPKP